MQGKHFSTECYTYDPLAILILIPLYTIVSLICRLSPIIQDFPAGILLLKIQTVQIYLTNVQFDVPGIVIKAWHSEE